VSPRLPANCPRAARIVASTRAQTVGNVHLEPCRMRLLTLPVLLATLATAPAASAAIKPCAELEREIAAKLDARGVLRYELAIVAPDAVGDRQVVGSCDGGMQRIVYRRLPADAPAAAPAAERPGESAN
jgi:hypothetical protein